MENSETEKILLRMEAQTKRRNFCAVLQTLFTGAILAACLAALVLVVRTMPQISAALTSIQDAAVQMNVVLDDAHIALGTINGTAGELTTTLQQVQTLDFASLNQAITNLAAVIEPMAKLFGGFR